MHINDLIFETKIALTANPSRTFLTMLGIIIGISSVIIMLSIGQGTKESVQSSVSSLGSNTLTVSPGSGGGGRPGSVSSGGNMESLKLGDVEAIRGIPLVASVAAQVTAKSQVIANSENVSVTVTGTTTEYAGIKSLTMETGIFLNDIHNKSFAKVAVLGADTRDSLFGVNKDPVGNKIKIKANTYTVIGVVQRQGGGGFGGNADEAVYIPLSTGMQYLTGGNHVGAINITSRDTQSLNQLQAEIEDLLIKRHKVKNKDVADFSIFNQAKIADSLNQITTLLTLLLGSVAGISLLVGGIGIMNMMLTTVRERTREIGLRKALGASSGDINSQFLLESIVVTFVGGSIGILIGVGVSQLITLSGVTQATVTTYSILLSFFVSAIVGIAFGYFPAQKAAKLHPIDALRYE